MENEIWKDIEGFEGYYQVSNLGNIKSLNYGNHGYEQNLVPKINNKGYKWVELVKGKKKKCLLIHRLVAIAFIDNPENFKVVNHIDENPLNCVADNLEWCTIGYNTRYSIERHKDRYKKYTEPPKVKKFKHYKTIYINQLTLDGEFIREWSSFVELKKKMNYHNTSIKECCEGKRKTAYGYKWEFADKNASSLFI